MSNVKMDVDIDTTRLEANLKKLGRSLSSQIDKTLLQTAQFGSDLILDRTKQGMGYKGKFRAYTPEYVKRKGQGWKSTSKTIGFG